MNLVNPKILQKRLANFDFPTGDRAKKIANRIAGWQAALKDHDLNKTKETEIQGVFLQRFFGEILGYVQDAEAPERNLIQHPTSEVDAQEPDGSLGFYSANERATKA